MDEPSAFLVFGGGSGIGRSVCATARDMGHRVISADRNVNRADPWESVAVDICDGSAVDALARDLRSTDTRIDSMVITAGIVSPAVIGEISVATTRAVINTNVTAAIDIVAAVHDLIADNGALVLFSSVAAVRGGGLLGASTYAASKAALEGLTRGLAREMSPRGIRVNCVAPGPTRTPMLDGQPEVVMERVVSATLLKRLGDPAEIAAAVMFLCSPAASFITGAVLPVDGGAHFA